MTQDNYDPNAPHLYISEIACPTDQEQRFVYYHEWEPSLGVFPIDGVDMKYLQGYLEGATTNRWSKLMIKNGMPPSQAAHFEDLVLRPLPQETLEELLDGTTLRAYYPYLSE